MTKQNWSDLITLNLIFWIVVLFGVALGVWGKNILEAIILFVK